MASTTGEQNTSTASTSGERTSTALPSMASTIVTQDRVTDGLETKCKHVEIVCGDVINHNYLSMERKDISNSLKLKLQKQWRLLKNDIPDSVYIRVYESRLDLIKAAIIGPPVTPFHDGLFCYDIYFAPGVPNEPPQVHSLGHFDAEDLQLNELVKSQAKDIHYWESNKPTILLKLLTAIQSKIFTSEPFFDHGTFERRKTFQLKNTSHVFNESIFIRSCQNLLSSVRNPPTDFEALVSEHVQSRGPFILKAILAYIKDQCVVGTYGDEDGSSAFNNPVKHSNTFKKEAKKLYKELKEAFTAMEDDTEQKKKRENELEKAEKHTLDSDIL